MSTIANRLLKALLWSVGCILLVGILLVGGYSFEYLADQPPTYEAPNPPSQAIPRYSNTLAAADRLPSAIPLAQDQPPPMRPALAQSDFSVAQRPDPFRVLQSDDDKDAEFEKEAKTLATKFRTASPEEQAKIRQQLEGQIEKHFEYRQQQRKQQIEELSSRLVSLGVAQQRRQENKLDILKRRLNDLLNPSSDLEWDDLRTKSDAVPGETLDGDKSRLDLNMAKYVEEFNELYAQERFADAEVIAKKARAINPRNSTALSMEQKARFARQNQFIEAKKRTSSEPTFQSILLSTWLKRLEIERSHAELQIALNALHHLCEEAEPQRIVRAVLGMSQSLPSLQDNVNGFDITRDSLVLLRSLPSDVVIDEVIHDLNKEKTRRLSKAFKSLITTFLGSACSLPNSESQYFGNYYSDVYVVNKNGWFSDFPAHSIESLRPEIRRKSKQLVDALVRIATHTPSESDWVIETSSYILENSEHPLSSYPNLVPLAEKVFRESKSRFTKGIAAVLLGGSNLHVPEVITFLKPSFVQALESRPEGSVYSPTYVTVVQQVVQLSSHLPSALNVLEEELTERCKSLSGTIVRTHVMVLLRGMGDLGASAKGALPLLRSIAESIPTSPGNQGTYQVVINGRETQIGGTDKLLADAIKRIEDAQPKPKPEPLPEEELGVAPPSAPTTETLPTINPDPTNPATASNEAEPTFDGIGYSAWLKMLETERKSEKLAMAMDACSRLVRPADERKIARAIFRAAGSMEGVDQNESLKVRNTALHALMRLNGDVVAEEFLVALRDPNAYSKGRYFQATFLSRGLQGCPANVQSSFRKSADEIVVELLKLIVAESLNADDLLVGASAVWRNSNRPLDSFPALKSVLMRSFEERRPISTAAKTDYYERWQAIANDLISAEPATPGLAMTLVNHIKSDLRDDSRVALHEDLILIGKLKWIGEALVPGLVDVFVDSWTRSLAQTNSSPYNNGACLEIIRQLGKIGAGARGYALLRELSIIAPTTDSRTFDQTRIVFSTAVAEALKKFNAADYPAPTRVLDDRSLIMGRWRVRSIPSTAKKINAVWIGPYKLGLFNQVEGHTNPELQIEYTYEIDSQKSPKEITLKREGFSEWGLYELTETTLRIQFAELGRPRPTSIAKDSSELPERNFLFEFERQSPEKPVLGMKVSEESKPAKKVGVFANLISNDFDYAWQSKDPYSPPDSDKFFPDDAEAGKKLDALFRNGQPAFEPNEEVLLLARSGLRRTRVRRDFVVRWVGNSYIWGKAEQNPDAIELTYHAADFKGPDANPFRTRHFAVYFGLSLVERKPPAILRTLVDLCLKVDDPNDLSRVAWGIGNQQDQLLATLKPHLSSDDEAVREKARVLEQIFSGQLKAFAWAADQAKKRNTEKYGDELPKFKTELAEGSSETRSKLLEQILTERISLIMDETFIPAFENAAKDPNEKVRNVVAIIAGDRWVWSAEQQNPEAIKLMLALSRDVDANVRYNAVYYGLSTVQKKDDDVVRRMLEMALDDRGNSDILGRIKWGMQNDKPRTKALLKEWIEGPDETRAANARTHYKDLTGEDAPDSEK